MSGHASGCFFQNPTVRGQRAVGIVRVVEEEDEVVVVEVVEVVTSDVLVVEVVVLPVEVVDAVVVVIEVVLIGVVLEDVVLVELVVVEEVVVLVDELVVVVVVIGVTRSVKVPDAPGAPSTTMKYGRPAVTKINCCDCSPQPLSLHAMAAEAHVSRRR